jgi:peptide/nickel transport system substrate-binding protein
MPIGNKSDEEKWPTALHRPGRRDLLKVLGVGGVTALAGCSGQNDQQSTAGDSTETDDGSVETNTPRPTEEDAAREVGGSYISGTATDAQSLNFYTTADGESADRYGLTLDGAYAITTEQEVFPLWLDLTTDDGRVYTAELRDNLQWSEPYGQMTAEDWVYQIKEVFQDDANWAGFPNQSDWKRNDEWIPVEKTGDLSFEIQLPEVDPAFPLKPIMWAQMCMPKGLIEKYRDDEDLEGFKSDEEVQSLSYTGNLGPYTFENWKREDEFVAVRNENYYMREAENVPEAWTNAPYFDDYTLKVIPEESTRLSALKSGEITVTGIPETKVKQFEQSSDVYVNKAPQPYMTSLIYNQRGNANFAEAIRKVEVRQALAQAVDKRAIVDNILRGYANVAHTFQPQFSQWYVDDEVTEYGVGDQYGAEMARSNLESAISDTPFEYDGDTVVDSRSGDAVKLRLVYSQGTDTTQTIAEFVKQEYAKIGLEVSEIKGLQFNTMLSKYAQNSWTGDGEPPWSAGPFNMGPREEAVSEEQWDLMVGIVFNTYPRTPTSTRDFTVERGGINYYGYYPETDFGSLFDEAAKETDEAARKELFGQIFGALSEEQPFNFLNMGVSIAGYQEQVQGPQPEFGFGWDSNTWYFSQQ